MSEFAIYVNTSKRDYRLAKALIASLKHYGDDPLIYVMPDDGYEHETIFGQPVWHPKNPRVSELAHYYTSLRVFYGPAQRFLYLDADILALRDIIPFLNHIKAQEPPFLLVNNQTHHAEQWARQSAEEREETYASWVGDPARIATFDNAYNFHRRVPFNSGFFASTKDSIDRKDLLETFRRARSFNERQNSERFTSSRKALFMGDQGFLNYYADVCDIRLRWADDAYIWGGDPALFSGERDEDQPFAGMFVHWAGCPRPGPIPLRPGIPKASEWRSFYWDYCREYGDWSGFGTDAAGYVLADVIRRLSRLKARISAAQ